ncbi:MAG: hypothetical protein P8L85_02010 [Rubripirellula sp.]|nr:hypothetical protein [Rubripirellula sp.]
MLLDDTPHIEQYLQFRGEFMGTLYAMIRDFRAWAKEVIRRQKASCNR